MAQSKNFMENFTEKKWYDNTSTVILLCIFIFPIGLYGLWKNQSIAKGWKIGVTAFVVLILFSVISGKNKSANSNTNSQNSEAQKYATYQKMLSSNPFQASAEKLKERDSALAKMKANDMYIKLVNEKSVDIKYIPILQVLGEVFTTANSGGVSITEDTHLLCSKIDGGIELMKDFIGLEFRGGIPVEFAEVTDRFIDKYRIAGNKGDLIGDANGNNFTIPFNYNLSITKAVFNPENKEALDEVGKAYKSGYFTWKKDKENDGTFHYPQYIFKENWIAYLKQNYPNSKYIPTYAFALSAIDLYNEYNANEVSADDKYKGKKIAVTGEVGNIAKDIMDKPYITLSQQDGFIPAVQCYVSKELATNISKGQIITLVGTCNGSVLTVVMLKDCELE